MTSMDGLPWGGLLDTVRGAGSEVRGRGSSAGLQYGYVVTLLVL